MPEPVDQVISGGVTEDVMRVHLVDSTATPVGVAGNPVSTLSAAATPQTILAQVSAAQVASGNSGSLVTTGVSSLEVDITVTALTGGTAPSITFSYQQLGADGVWYVVWTGAVLTAAGTQRTSIGAGLATTAVVLGSGRLVWTFGGTISPTSVTFSASIVGR